jgi:hypothetical protein
MNPFWIYHPMFWIAMYAMAAQYAILGDPGTVSRDNLGHLGAQR